jgi:hypothetical protein
LVRVGATDAFSRTADLLLTDHFDLFSGLAFDSDKTVTRGAGKN